MRKLMGILLVLIVLLTGCNNVINTQSINSEINKSSQVNVNNDLKISFIDVGQGDSILINCNNEYMLIDAGENNKGNDVSAYLKSLGVMKLKYIIGTHPHSDHIGGLDVIINSFQVENIILPDITNTTDSFKDVLLAIKNKGLQITTAKVNDKYTLGNANFVILSPNSKKYDDLNNYSVGIKLTYKDFSFVSCGDAESISESEIVKNGIDISASILKLGHHGSTSSSSSKFMKAVNPKVAIVSCGIDNKYGHPHQKTLDYLNKNKIDLYRTDKLGTIELASNGEIFTINNKTYSAK